MPRFPCRAPTYKLTYFDVRGLGEPARLLFHLAGVKFEDKRYGLDGSFMKDKSQTPFGQLPVLEVDGLQIPQSSAICRYLARKFGFAGRNREEEAWVDAVVDQWKDFFMALREVFMARALQKPVEDVERIVEKTFNPAKDTWFAILNGLLEKSKSGWLVGDGLTWADVVVFDSLVSAEKMGFFDAEKEKRMDALRRRVEAVPRIREYLASRPDTIF